MRNTPSDEHTDEFEQLAGLSALGVLEGDELALFEAHTTRCERCRLMVRLDREALARVSLAAPAMDPSPDFKERLMRRAADELAASAAPSVEGQPTRLRPRPANVLPFYRRSPWMSALAAAFVVALVTAGAFAFENQTVATYPLTGSAPGSARVVVHRSGDAELDMDGVPNPDPGFVYEAWIIPPGAKPVAAGITSTGEAKLKLSGDLRGATVAITKEPGHVDAPTSDPLMLTVVQ
ncbi:MAG: anti-sigma factor [Chloroflexota bacterium]|nr:anti-sigma factor [Chloroflexota bacterium]